MAKFVITPGDALRGKPIKPGWHPAEIIKVEEKAAKTDGSTNVFIYWKITGGEFKNHEVRDNFNEKFTTPVIQFIEALGAQCKKDENTDVELGENLVGKKLEIYVINGEWEGRTTNKVEQFRPIGAAKKV